jgi:hypothetical protein
MMPFKQLVRNRVDRHWRDAVWALRTRGDTAVLSAVARGKWNLPHAAGSTTEHLRASLGWLCAAQQATGNLGVASFYDIRTGEWGPPYPETTGYIIPTFFDYAEYAGAAEFRERALRMADWLLTVQLECGAFPIGPLWPDWERSPLVFDTGQIVQGLVRAHADSGRMEFLAAARRAGDWLAAIQDADGCWRQFTPLGHGNTYNARTAWALLQLHQAAGDPHHQTTALRNLRWVLAQQMPDGWFARAGFTPEEDPLTHTIAYTIEGVLQAGLLLGDEAMIGAARRAADAVLERQTADGFLRGRYGPGWRASVDWSCLTGTAQMALIWLELYALNGEARYQQAARLANQHVMQAQNTRSSRPGLRGGVGGSQPIYGDYEPYRLLNWAAKFFADSLMLAERQRLRGQAVPAAAEARR